jgi:hypothetical protein
MASVPPGDPPRLQNGSTMSTEECHVRVTGEHPKTDWIACPWLDALYAWARPAIARRPD